MEGFKTAVATFATQLPIIGGAMQSATRRAACSLMLRAGRRPGCARTTGPGRARSYPAGDCGTRKLANPLIESTRDETRAINLSNRDGRHGPGDRSQDGVGGEAPQERGGDQPGSRPGGQELA